jgi:hypothetical protein
VTPACLVVHAYNPSYLRGRDWRTSESSRPAQAKLVRPKSQKQNKNTKDRGTVQVMRAQDTGFNASVFKKERLCLFIHPSIVNTVHCV